MVSIRPTLVSALAWIAIASGAGPSVALEPQRSVSVSFDVPLGCPSEDVFVREFRSRAPSVSVSPEAPLRLHIEIERNAQLFVGHIVIGQGAASTFTRRIQGKSCAEVVSAVALVSAITLEGGARGAEGRTSGSTDSGGTERGAGSAAANGASSASGNATTAGAKADASRTDTLDAGPSETSDDRNEPRPVANSGIGHLVDVGVGADVVNGSPAPIGGAAHAFVGGVVGGSSVDRRLLSWDLRGRFDATFPAGLGGSLHPGADVRFERLTVGLELCPFGLSLGAFRWSLCGRGDGGMLLADSAGVPASRDVVRPWADAGLGTRLRLDLAGPLFVDVAGYALASVVRDRYIFAPDATVYRAPWLLGGGTVELGLSL